MANEGFLTPSQLVERWGNRIKLRTINTWRTNGGGPPFTKIGGAVLYPVASVQKWEQDRTVESTSQYGAKK